MEVTVSSCARGRAVHLQVPSASGEHPGSMNDPMDAGGGLKEVDKILPSQDPEPLPKVIKRKT